MQEYFEELFSDTIYTASQIKKNIDLIRLKSFPSDTPINLLNVYYEICSLCQEYAVQLKIEHKDAPDETTQFVKFISSFLRGIISPDIRYADGASVERTPGSFVSSLEEFVEKTNLLPKSTLFVRPQWHYNFKILELIEYYKSILNKFLYAFTGHPRVG